MGEKERSKRVCSAPHSPPPGQETAIETRRGDSGHTGIWYNAEAYRYHNLGAYPNRVSLTIYITQPFFDVLSSCMITPDIGLKPLKNNGFCDYHRP